MPPASCILRTLAALLLAACVSAQQVPVAPDLSEYLLPIGGPKELVSEADKQRNVRVAADFFNSLSGAIGAGITLEFLKGNVPSTPDVVPGLAEDVKGQIVPLGFYDNFIKSVEYFFMMPRAGFVRTGIVAGYSWFGVPIQPGAPADPSAKIYDSVKNAVTHAFGDGNAVYIRAEYSFGFLLGNRSFAGPYPGEPTFIFTGPVFFNREGEICGYDLSVPNLASMFQDFDVLRQAGFPTKEQLDAIPDSDYKRAYLLKEGVTTWLEEICDVATGDMCFPVVGTKYYKNKADCMRKLGQKREGTYSELDQDTLACRALHRLVVPSRPEGHCLHLSADLPESEGGVCIDRTTESYNKRSFQCGYDDVGYTPAAGIAGAWVTPEYPYTAADFALTEYYTVPGPICTPDDVGSSHDGDKQGAHGQYGVTGDPDRRRLMGRKRAE